MLTDKQVSQLRDDARYVRTTKVGLELFVDNILESGADDLRPTISSVIKVVSKLWRARTIRFELQRCTCAFLERMINQDLEWPRKPQEVELICNAHEAGYKWMRYDEPRVTAVFSRSYALLTDASFRDLLKEHSTLSETQKNQALVALRSEAQTLQERVIRSIRTRGIFDELTDLNADEYYRTHEAEIQRKFLEGTQGGPLGLPERHE
jgi:hypothetical protein